MSSVYKNISTHIHTYIHTYIHAVTGPVTSSDSQGLSVCVCVQPPGKVAQRLSHKIGTYACQQVNAHIHTYVDILKYYIHTLHICVCIYL
jgi:hypothetical protein